ncbi:MAG: hypothetical protein GY866_23185 [Proteobacteria bacterium]|nr:hypothetical protein [Pseudomonadota bacterium]
MTLTISELRHNLPKAIKAFENLEEYPQYVVVGGTACLLHDIEITTFDVDLFFLVDAEKLLGLKKRLSSLHKCDWHYDDGFFDSHGNSISNLVFDFRLIESKNPMYDDFHTNRVVVDLEGCPVCIRTLDSLISDAREAAVHREKDGFELERIQHFKRRAALLEKEMAVRKRKDDSYA